MFGFPPSGRRMRVWGVNFFRMEGDKIAERWGQFDVLTMMQQLGLARPADAGGAPRTAPTYGDPHRAGHGGRRRTSRRTRPCTAGWSRRS
mgnify:CR=1 FL=1